MIGTLIVIPARLKSPRLPEKPLIKLAGRELVMRVLDGARSSKAADRVIVATDSDKIAKVVEAAGGEVMMTPGDCPTGSDRVAYVAERVPSKYVVNVQGDDPMVDAQMLDPLISAVKSNPGVKLALLAKEIEKPDEIDRDSIVKMVFDQKGMALYFSRSRIPFPRTEEVVYYKHIGPYAWDRDMLLKFATMPQTPLEKSESLEMLRLLEYGYSIKCVPTSVDTIEIDTQDDVEEFEKHISSLSK